MTKTGEVLTTALKDHYDRGVQHETSAVLALFGDDIIEAPILRESAANAVMALCLVVPEKLEKAMAAILLDTLYAGWKAHEALSATQELEKLVS
jgi:hypothetical protein